MDQKGAFEMPTTIGASDLTTFIANTKARAGQVNANFDAIRGTKVPIDPNTSAASDMEHDLGTEEHRFRKAQIGVGYLFPGMVMPFHDYNGALSPGHGWMKCDGRQVTIANYDTEFSSGAWLAYIGASVGSSDLANLYLPDLQDSTYLAGITSTAQDGSSAITTFGTTANTVNLAHTHAVTGSGSLVDTKDGDHTFYAYGFATGLSETSRLSASQDVRPKSIGVQYYMRII